MDAHYMKKGFSLVEVITILFIVSVGLLGILSLIIQNIQSQTYNKNNLVAYQLAQEGVELIRRVRDTNWEAGNLSYKTNLDDGSYYMDYLDNVPIPYGGSAADLLLKFDGNGFYVHGAGTDSGFSRLITIANIDDYSFSVNVSVTWREANRNAAYDLQAILYDWR